MLERRIEHHRQNNRYRCRRSMMQPGCSLSEGTPLRRTVFGLERRQLQPAVERLDTNIDRLGSFVHAALQERCDRFLLFLIQL